MWENVARAFVSWNIFEILKPQIKELDFSFLSTANFLSGRHRIKSNITINWELPLANAKIDEPFFEESEFILGNIFVGFLIFWGLVVIADSPLFSTLVAQNAIKESRGTALTIVNCVGFSITIVSIQMITALQNSFNPNYLYMLLAFGPLLGLIALYERKPWHANDNN